MSATGEGKVFLTPDIASVSVGVHSQGKDVNEALGENNAKAQSIADALKALGVDPKDIQTSAFTISPQQQTGPNGEITGEILYMVDNTVNVTVRDLTKMGQILDTVVKSGANNIYNIQFDVTNKEAAVDQARKMAIDNAKKLAGQIAEESGVTLGAINSVNVSSNPAPVPMYEGKGGMAASANVPVASGQLAVIVDATVTYELK
jgi:uncharacterized protein